MAQGRFAIQIDTREIIALAERLEGVNRDTLGDAVVVAINGAADNADELAKQQMLFGINLTEQYVDRKLVRRKATTQNPEAEIRAPSSREYLTNLSHYDPQQMIIPVRFPNRKPKPKGRPGIGIPAGYKGNGKAVEVTRGQRKRVATAFSIQGLTDREDSKNLLLFQRSQFTGKIKALVGPSVYQLFRIAATAIQDEVYDDLSDRLVNEANKVMKKVFE